MNHKKPILYDKDNKIVRITASKTFHFYPKTCTADSVCHVLGKLAYLPIIK